MFFSTTFFDFGLIILLITIFHELLNLLLCRLWKIQVEELSIFFKIGGPLFRKKIGSITYLLGWIPYGSYIKPVGATPEELEKIHVGDLPFTFLGKSKSKRIVFYAVPYVLWTSIFLCCCLLVSPGEDFSEGFRAITRFLLHICESAIGKISKAEFVKSTQELIAGRQIIFFLISLSMALNIVLTPFSRWVNWLIEERRSWPVKTAGIVLMIALLYFYAVKLFFPLFAFAGYAKGFGYLLSFSMGAYLVGTIAFFLIVLVARLRQR